MKAQCLCVMGPKRVPILTCPKCEGTGFYDVKFPDEDDVEMIWLGRCPRCGAHNGCQIQHKGEPIPKNGDPYWRCVNRECSCPPVELVAINSVTSWSAICSQCSVLHYADFQQRPGDDPPTLTTHPRRCQRCGSSAMMWVLDSDVAALN